MKKPLLLVLLFGSAMLIACGGGSSGDDNDNDMQEAMVDEEAMMDAEMGDDPMMEDEMDEEEMMEDDPVMDDVDPRNGMYSSAEDGFSTELSIRNTATMDAPLSDTCVGSIELLVDVDAENAVSGEGSCLTTSNAATFSVTANFDSDTSFSGEIVILFSMVEHVIPISGMIDGDTITVNFMGTTEQTATIEIDWLGMFVASRLAAM